MPSPDPIDLDLVIFGGGAAGLWLLDEVVRLRYRVLLLEANDLGSGQTISSQGILHGGTKYSLGGILTPAARAIRAMPLLWRRCLAGEREPDLSAVARRAEFTYLWQSGSIGSALGMLGARAGLRVRPVVLAPDERPPLLRSCPGTVARLDEQVIDPQSLLFVLADRHRDRILKVDPLGGFEFESRSIDDAASIRLTDPGSGERAVLRARWVVLCAGEGNEVIRSRAGLRNGVMQRRPLHMAVARGMLPILNGHCVEGAAPRLTITSAADAEGRVIWQLGGRIAENGVDLDQATLIARAAEEVSTLLPDLRLEGVAWTTYRVARAEGATRSGLRPEGMTIRPDGRFLTCWPTKLVLAPRLASAIVQRLGPPELDHASLPAAVRRWTRPVVALPPWENNATWTAGA